MSLGHDEVGADLVLRTEVNQQVATAKMYPRNVANALMGARKLITMSQSTAEDCIYAVPRGGKSIEGPSARFAEILAATYGNLRIATRIVQDGDERYVTAQGACMDVEANVTRTVEVKRRATYQDGKRFNDDMYLVTANAASSIAARNAVLASIPRAVWEPLYELARRTAVGEGETFINTRSRILGFLQKMGADEARVLAFLKVQSVDAITPDMAVLLRGVASAIKEGDTTVDDAMPAPDAKPAANAPASVQDKLGVKPVVKPEEKKPVAVAEEKKVGPVLDWDAQAPVNTSPTDAGDARAACASTGCLSERDADSLFCSQHRPSLRGKKA